MLHGLHLSVSLGITKTSGKNCGHLLPLLDTVAANNVSLYTFFGILLQKMNTLLILPTELLLSLQITQVTIDFYVREPT